MLVCKILTGVTWSGNTGRALSATMRSKSARSSAASCVRPNDVAAAPNSNDGAIVVTNSCAIVPNVAAGAGPPAR